MPFADNDKQIRHENLLLKHLLSTTLIYIYKSLCFDGFKNETLVNFII